ncbi:MAG TPA: hypothetical protein PKJ30_13635 [Leptospiraceae bacterium]|nr:hypothetical protein [Leptospiraceae bacterium]
MLLRVRSKKGLGRRLRLKLPGDLLKLQEDRTIFRPAMHAERRERELRYWNKGVERVKNWSE